MEVIRTELLSKRYGRGAAAVDAVRSVDLTINRGEFIAVVGPSGSGKSTLLHLLGGLDRPTGGKVFIEGKDIFSLNEKGLSIFRRRMIGFVFQFYNLVPVLNAEENILLPLKLDRTAADPDHLQRLISLLDIKDRLDHLPNQLSGGQQQRVAIARALAAKPALVLADEPTGNLDRRSGREVMDLLKHMALTFGQTLLVITHDPETAERAERIIEIEDGALVSDTAAREVQR
jgi:putative ABC transport system ATP-binding protein